MNKTLRALILLALLPTLISCGGGGVNSALLGILPSEATQTSPNAIPVADAGLTQNVRVGSLVTLDGTASRDANNESLTYLWALTSKPVGSAAALSLATSAKPTFTADLSGSYSFSLIVNDGKENSLLASVTVVASIENSAPVANAGTSQNAIVNTLVRLDGTASSDANSDILTYRWAFIGTPTGSKAALSNASSPVPTFTPDLIGSYVLSLIVNDGKLDSRQSAVTVIVSAANAAPVAVPGTNQNVTVGTLVTLDGTASSDANYDFLTYRWNIITKPTASTSALSSLSSPKPSFTPNVAGVYVVTLIVNDGKVDSDVAATSITASVANSAPVAVVGANQNVVIGASVTLDGSASSDANLDPLTYKWTLVTKPTNSVAALSSATVARPTFTADLVGTYVAALMVNDGKVDSTLLATTVTASILNAAPVANAGNNQTVARTATVTLSGASSTDANSDILTYRWTLTTRPTGSAAALSSATVVSPTFVADLAGVYVATLVVNDGKVDSNVATVAVTAN